MEQRPKGHGDYANLIRDLWTGAELRRAAEELEDLERHDGYARLKQLLEARDAQLVDRLVVDKPEDVRSTDQVIGILNGLRQSQRAIDSIKYEAHQSRERDQQAAAEADAEGATT
jgi:hypothetical protein